MDVTALVLGFERSTGRVGFTAQVALLISVDRSADTGYS
jgi:hypothetical protein